MVNRGCLQQADVEVRCSVARNKTITLEQSTQNVENNKCFISVETVLPF